MFDSACYSFLLILILLVLLPCFHRINSIKEEEQTQANRHHSSMQTAGEQVPVTSQSRGSVVAFYLFSALHISITTSTDSAQVLALAALNTSQSMLGNIRGSAGHCI